MTQNAEFLSIVTPLACVQFHIVAGNAETMTVSRVYARTLTDGATVTSEELSVAEGKALYDDLIAQGFAPQPMTGDSQSRTQSLAHPDSVIGRLHPLGLLLPREDV